MFKYLSVFLLFLFCSCTVGPDYEEPIVFDDEQIAKSLHLKETNSQVSKQWYKQFNDKSLNILIETALTNSPTIKGGVAKLRQARTIAAINRTQYLPTLSADTQYEYTKASKNIGLAADTNYFQIGLDAAWEIDVWGAGRRLNEQSLAEFEQAYFSLHNLQVMLTAEVANTYFLLRTTQAQLSNAQNNLKLQQDILQTVTEKYKSGLTDAATYHQAQYLTESTKALIPTLENQITSYKNALAVLTGVLPDNLPADVLSSHKNPVQKAYHYDIYKLYELPADIIRSRPDVKAAERAIAAQNAAIGQAIAALYPNLSIGGLFGFQSGTGSKLFNSDSQAYGYTPKISLPLFNWGKLQSNIQLQQEIKAETFENYRQTILQAVEELQNSISAVQTEYQHNRAQQNAVNNMQKVLRAMRDKYESGLIEFSELLKAEQDLLNAQTDFITSNGTVYQNIIAFYKATGGGYN